MAVKINLCPKKVNLSPYLLKKLNPEALRVRREELIKLPKKYKDSFISLEGILVPNSLILRTEGYSPKNFHGALELKKGIYLCFLVDNDAITPSVGRTEYNHYECCLISQGRKIKLTGLFKGELDQENEQTKYFLKTHTIEYPFTFLKRKTRK